MSLQHQQSNQVLVLSDGFFSILSHSCKCVQVRGGHISFFKNLEQPLSKRQVVEVLVFFDFIKMLWHYLHEHESHESFWWNLADCEVRFHLVDPVFNRQFRTTFVSLDLAFHVAAKSTLCSFQRLTVDEEFPFSFGIDGYVARFLLRVADGVVVVVRSVVIRSTLTWQLFKTT